jgi:hypothetical protein
LLAIRVKIRGAMRKNLFRGSLNYNTDKGVSLLMAVDSCHSLSDGVEGEDAFEL